jgi:6-phosphogluconolactonase (cycloisomerase 2 family)
MSFSLLDDFSDKPLDLIYSEDLNDGYKNILLIDNSVEDAQMFLTSANDSTFPIIYSQTSTKTELLELLKTKFTTIERIGFVFTSNLDSIKNFLDNEPFFTPEEASSSPYSENLEFLLEIIKEFQIKNIDFLACNTLNYSNWENYYSILSKETGVIVGASNDKTGNIKYGGDWVMESTSQDVELVYFTETIEYYSYLLDNSTWATGLSYPRGLTTYGSFMYVVNQTSKTISKINLSNGSMIKSDWTTGLNSPRYLTMSGSYLYVSNTSNNTISQINLSDGSIVKSSWATGLNSPRGLTTYGSYLYAANITNGTISKISLSNGSIIKSDWATGLSGPIELTISGSSMYVSSSSTGIINKISLSDGSMIKNNWTTGLSNPIGLAVSGSYLYVSNSSNGTISQIKLSDGSMIKSHWATGLKFPTSLTVSGSYLYVSNTNNNTISQFDLPTASYICFPANTPVLTDQGMIAIERINPDKHTINNKQIVDITKTITLDNYLVCFKKNALGMNYPIEKTIMSKDHKLYYQGQMLEAKKFVGKFENVIKIKYDGEILYNVLMEKYDKICVNNLICETLHPDNVIAKLYTRKCKYTNEARDKIIALLEKCAEKKDYKTYNKIVKSC